MIWSISTSEMISLVSSLLSITGLELVWFAFFEHRLVLGRTDFLGVARFLFYNGECLTIWGVSGSILVGDVSSWSQIILVFIGVEFGNPNILFRWSIMF